MDFMLAFRALVKAALQRPFEERPEFSACAQPAPAETAAGYPTFCVTVT